MRDFLGKDDPKILELRKFHKHHRVVKTTTSKAFLCSLLKGVKSDQERMKKKGRMCRNLNYPLNSNLSPNLNHLETTCKKKINCLHQRGTNREQNRVHHNSSMRKSF